MEDEAGFLSWAFGQTSKIKGGIEDRERDLNRIIKEGAYPVLQDEVAKRKMLTVTFGRGVVDMATAATGTGKGATTEIATAEVPIVTGGLTRAEAAIATGGKSGPKWKWSGNIPESQASEAYAAIRASETDVAAIARYKGLNERSVERLKKIKDYLFNNPEWTHADSDIASAWHRLRTGAGTQEDMLLLKHEVAEMWLRKNKNMGYSQAHKEANELFNWEQAVWDRQNR